MFILVLLCSKKLLSTLCKKIRNTSAINLFLDILLKGGFEAYQMAIFIAEDFKLMENCD